MRDKRFMPKNRSNVGKNVTINRCISTLISFSAFKKRLKRYYIAKFLDYSYFYAFWVQIFEAILIDKKQKVILLWFYYVPVVCKCAPFPRTWGTAETLIFRPAANRTYNSHMQGQLTDKTTDVYTAGLWTFCRRGWDQSQKD